MTIDWNNPKYIDLPDLRMAVFEAGTARDDRPSVVLCHGWPEVAYSWRKVVPQLVEAGWHVIIPEQRGYGFTGNALSDAGDESGVPLYDMQHLTGDMAHLLDAYGLEKAVFAGHDWGGIMIWQLPFFQAERIAGLIGVNTPFIARLSQDPIELMRGALGDDFYIVMFQNYGQAEAILDADPALPLRCLYRQSAGAQAQNPAPDASSEVWEKIQLLKMIRQEEASWPGVALLEDADFAYYVDAYKRSGFRGGINWYRNFSRNWQASAGVEQTVPQPSLMICAADDRVLPPSMADGMDAYVSDLETHIIDDCGHWTQNEQPEALSHLMLDWLTRRFA
jgi:pimeloyl-ACP methyl ester carboxylesterase